MRKQKTIANFNVPYSPSTTHANPQKLSSSLRGTPAVVPLPLGGRLYDSLAAAGAVLANVWVGGVTMPVVDSKREIEKWISEIN